MVQQAAGYGNGGPSQVSAFPIRYADGAVKLSVTDLASDGFGLLFGRTGGWASARLSGPAEVLIRKCVF